MTYAEATRGLLRDTILDSVGGLITDRGWAATTMSDVAAASGVSRQTIYNEFGSRPELAQAFVLRESERFIFAVSDAVRTNHDQPWVALQAALEVFLTAAASDPLFKSVIDRDGEASMLSLLTTEGGPLVSYTTGVLRELILEIWPGVDDHDAYTLANALVRLAISHASLPDAPIEATATDIARMLGPFLDSALDRARQPVQ